MKDVCVPYNHSPYNCQCRKVQVRMFEMDNNQDSDEDEDVYCDAEDLEDKEGDN